MTDDQIACGGPSPASMRGGALVGAFDLTRSGIEELTLWRTYSCIHGCLELSMNTGHLNYHEYEYRKAALIMSMTTMSSKTNGKCNIQLNSRE